MHNGLFATLEDVLDFYDDVDSRRGNDRNANVSRDQLDPSLRQLRCVDDDDEDLLAFLGAFERRLISVVRPPKGAERACGWRKDSLGSASLPSRCQWLEVAPCPLSTR
jgi:hypothetical protein